MSGAIAGPGLRSTPTFTEPQQLEPNAKGRGLGKDSGKYEELLHGIIDPARNDGAPGSLLRQDKITGLYESITAPRDNERAPTDMLDRFNELRDMAPLGMRSRFTVDYEKDNQGKWQLGFKIGDTTLYRSDKLQDTPNQSYDQFRAEHAIREAIRNSEAAFRAGPPEIPLPGETDQLKEERLALRASTESEYDLKVQSLVPRLELRSSLHCNTDAEVVDLLKGLPNSDRAADLLRQAKFGDSNLLALWVGSALDPPAAPAPPVAPQTSPVEAPARTDAAPASPVVAYTPPDDLWQAGLEKEAITKLYASITSPESPVRSPGDMNNLFHQLRDMAVDDKRSLFTVDHGMDDQGQWQFSFKIDGNEIYRSEKMQNSEDVSYNQFRADHEIRGAVSNVKTAFHQGEQDTFSPENYVKMNVALMKGGDEVHQAGLELGETLDDPGFSRERFLEIRPARNPDGSEDPNNFVAVFRGEKENDPPREWPFSNAPSPQNEMCGDRLKDFLANGDYKCLRDIASAGHLTGSDNLLKFAVLAPRLDLQEKLSVDSDENLVAHLKGLPESSASFDLLRQAEIGKTNLLELWFGNRPDIHAEGGAPVAGGQAPTGRASEVGNPNTDPSLVRA